MNWKHTHYGWLEDNLVQFLKNMKVPNAEWHEGLISAHGDKFYCDRCEWDEHDIPFEHGVAIGLLVRLHPWSDEVWDLNHCFIKVNLTKWVIDNYQRFKPFLPPSFKEQGITEE